MLARGKYNIEWVPRPADNSSPSGFVWFLMVVVLVSAVSLVVTLCTREGDGDSALAEDDDRPPLVRTVAEAVAEPAVAVTNAPAPSPPAAARPSVAASRGFKERSVRLRNLLMRLEEAERKKDTVLAISTIEQIRLLPDAADLDNALSRRLGTLNYRWLFELHNAQWVREVEVKRGDSASRIAGEHGSTLASFSQLNGGKVGSLRAGAKVRVLDHPRFSLVVHRQSKYADLFLRGKFFRRYDLVQPTALVEGSYAWGAVAGKLEIKNRGELDALLPKKTSVLVSEL